MKSSISVMPHRDASGANILTPDDKTAAWSAPPDRRALAVMSFYTTHTKPFARLPFFNLCGYLTTLVGGGEGGVSWALGGPRKR